MASANPNAILATCPGCGALYDFPASMAGRRGRCAKCNTPFTVPAAPERIPLDELPAYIGVDCRICGTRLYGGPDQVGKELKCPDCDARTVLPPPPKSKGPNIPEAMFGEQYELWEPDEEPKAAEFAAHQPQFIAVKCRKCDTLMYATERQVGQTIACPDCGMKHVVPPPARPKPKPPVVAADAPMLDTAAAPPDRPVLIPPRRKMEYEERQEAEYARAVAESRRTGKPMKIDARGRPILPRWPLLTGVLPFFFSPGMPARWLAVAAGGFAAGSILVGGFLAATGGSPMAGMCLFAAGSILCMIVAAAAASYLMTIVTESSEGVDQVQSWPLVFDSLGDLLTLVVAGMVSAFPGWLAAQLLLDEPSHQVLAIGVSIIICLPVVLLSQLDVGSPWGVISPRMLSSLFYCPFSWLTLYLETALIVGACLVGARAAPWSEITFAIAAAIAVGVLFLYARLLGRLAWKLAETIPGEES